MNKIIPQNIQDLLSPDLYWLSDNNNVVTSKDHIYFMVERFGLETPPQEVYDYLETTAETSVELGGDYEPNYPVPIVTDVSRDTVAVNKPSVKLVVSGEYFSPQNYWSATGGVVVTVLSSSITEVTLALNTLSLSEGQTFDLMLDGISVKNLVGFLSLWIDFREGGSVLGTYEVLGATQDNVIRDSEGIYLNTTANGWSKLLATPGVSVDRLHNQGIKLIFKLHTSGSLMFGMIASGHGVDTSMYNETHVGFYLSSNDSLWGYYSAVEEQNRRGISEYDRLKMVFPTTMEVGATYQIFGLRNTDTWDDGSLILEGVVPAGTRDLGDTVYPCLTPNNALNYRLVAFSRDSL